VILHIGRYLYFIFTKNTFPDLLLIPSIFQIQGVGYRERSCIFHRKMIVDSVMVLLFMNMDDVGVVIMMFIMSFIGVVMVMIVLMGMFVIVIMLKLFALK
jgi:hypothetical protein